MECHTALSSLFNFPFKLVIKFPTKLHLYLELLFFVHFLPYFN